MAKVLVIEDNPDEREIYRQLLYYNGHDVTACATAMEGVLAARRELPDVILCDVELPDLYGGALKGMLKATPMCDVPIVGISSNDLSSAEVARAGFVAFYRKPLSAIELLRAVERPLKPTPLDTNLSA